MRARGSPHAPAHHRHCIHPQRLEASAARRERGPRARCALHSQTERIAKRVQILDECVEVRCVRRTQKMKSRVVEAVVMPLPTRDFDDRAGLGRAAASYIAAMPSFDNLEYSVCLEMPSSRAARDRFPPNFASASKSADF
jgi:hypothetical protein